VRLRSTVEDCGGRVILLDQYYSSVTFVEGGRRSSPLSLIHRPYGDPIAA
jgi:hypothetical protein